MSNEQTIDTFWINVSNVGQPDVCWEWQRSCNGSGYGQWYDGSRTHYAHRVAYQRQYGAILHGLLVCHRCDNPKCCNYHHLFLGTIADNMRDKATKHRAIAGEAHYRHKLTADQVRDIRAEYAIGETTYAKLAQKYGVSHTVIQFAILRKTWKHIV